MSEREEPHPTYPQIAVAVGGALPMLPEQRRDVPRGLTDGPDGPIYIGPSYKQ